MNFIFQKLSFYSIHLFVVFLLSCNLPSVTKNENLSKSHLDSIVENYKVKKFEWVLITSDTDCSECVAEIKKWKTENNVNDMACSYFSTDTNYLPENFQIVKKNNLKIYFTNEITLIEELYNKTNNSGPYIIRIRDKHVVEIIKLTYLK